MAHVAALDKLAGDSPAMRALLVPVLVSVLLLFVLLRYFPTSNREKKKLPPSPPALPLIGHVHLLGAHPHVSIRSLAARYGDLMLLRLGTVPTLVASSPRAAEAVLRTHDQSLASRPHSLFGDILGYGPSDVGFMPYGDEWRQAKKLVKTHLLSTNKVQSYRAAREEEVAVVIDKIRRAAVEGAAVNLSELLSSFTTDMLSRTVAGKKFRTDGLDEIFRELVHESMAALAAFNLENFFPGLAKVAGGVLMLPLRRKAEKLRDRWDQILDKLIDEHVSMAAAAVAAGAGPAPLDTDFTHVLLSVQEEFGLTRDRLKGILSDLFGAGTDTGSLLLEYAMAELMLHQDVMVKLQAEVRSSIPKGQEGITEDDITGMPYLKAVIKEVIRLHPPNPFLLPHFSMEECNIDGYVVPAGTTIFVNVWAIARDPRVWDAPEEFMPKRFFNKGGTEGVDFKGMDFQLLPFGSGRRMCPGMNFGMASVEILLANLLYHFDWEMDGVNGIDMTEVFGLHVRRKEKLILTPKLSSAVKLVEG